ncbi:MAG: minor capsid protein [Oscillospiraceae bacterium]|nr:minor capsid protein [Oscillospiraceae bacterium]
MYVTKTGRVLSAYEERHHKKIIKSISISKGVLRYYRIIAENDERICDVCAAQDGTVYPEEFAEAGANFPPFHPNCRCTVEWLSEGISGLPQNLTFVEELEEMLRGIYEGLQARGANAFSSFEGFLDWLTLGVPRGMLESNLARTRIMLAKPNWYTIGNYMTSGIFDTFRGALKPDRPLSLRHWLDSLLAATVVYASYRAIEYNLNIQRYIASLSAGTEFLPLANKIFTNETSKGVWNFTSDAKGMGAAQADFYAMKPFNTRTLPGGRIIGDLPNGNTINIHPGISVGYAPSLEILDRATGIKIKIRY